MAPMSNKRGPIAAGFSTARLEAHVDVQEGKGDRNCEYQFLSLLSCDTRGTVTFSNPSIPCVRRRAWFYLHEPSGNSRASGGPEQGKAGNLLMSHPLRRFRASAFAPASRPQRRQHSNKIALLKDDRMGGGTAEMCRQTCSLMIDLIPSSSAIDAAASYVKGFPLFGLRFWARWSQLRRCVRM